MLSFAYVIVNIVIVMLMLLFWRLSYKFLEENIFPEIPFCKNLVILPSYEITLIWKNNRNTLKHFIIILTVYILTIIKDIQFFYENELL